MNIYINDDELVKNLKDEAKKTERSISYIVRLILKKFFNKGEVK